MEARWKQVIYNVYMVDPECVIRDYRVVYDGIRCKVYQYSGRLLETVPRIQMGHFFLIAMYFSVRHDQYMYLSLHDMSVEEQSRSRVRRIYARNVGRRRDLRTHLAGQRGWEHSDEEAYSSAGIHWQYHTGHPSSFVASKESHCRTHIPPIPFCLQ